MSEVRSVTVVVNGNVRGLRAAYRQGKIATDDFADSLERADRGTTKLRDSQSKLATTTSRNSQRYQSLTKSLNDNNRAMGTHQSKLGRSVATTDQYARGLDRSSKSTDKLGKSLGKNSNDIDRFSGRLALLVQAGVALGPALTAGAIPALAGLAAQGLASGVGLGVLIGSFQGVGDGLKAVNKAALEPTTANLNDARVAMSRLTPEGRQLVTTLMDAKRPLTDLRNVAQTEMFPGLIRGIDQLEKRFPQMEQLVGSTASELGDVFDDLGSSLSSEDWDAAFNYAIASTGPLIDDTAHSAGNLAKTLVNLWVAVQPLTGDWSSGFREAAESAEKWSSSVSQTDGFQKFLDYAGDVGPEVAHTLGQITLALIQIGQAAAPVSGPLIKLLGDVAEITGNIAASDIGSPILAGVLAMSAYNRALSIRAALEKRLSASQVTSTGGTAAVGGSVGSSYVAQIRNVRTLKSDLGSLRKQQLAVRKSSDGMVPVPLLRKGAVETGRVTSAMKGLGKTAAGVAAVGIATSGMADKIGVSHTASLALLGTMGGPWGAALGGAAGAVMDLASATDTLSASTSNADRLMGSSSVNVDALVKQRAKIKQQYDDTSLLGSHTLGMWNPRAQGDLRKAESTYRELGMQIDDLKGRAAGTSGLGKALFGGLGSGANQYATRLDAASGAQDRFLKGVEQANSVLSARGNWSAYKSALLDARDAIKENGKTLNEHTREGLANRNALDAVGSAAVTAAQDLSGIKQATYLGNARKEFVDLATSMGMSRRAARDLADSIHLVDGTKIGVQVKLADQGAHAGIAALSAGLAGLGRQRPKPKADLDTKSLTAKQRQAGNFLQALDGKHPRPKADLRDGVSAPARSALGLLNQLDGKRATSYINTIHTTTTRAINKIIPMGDSGNAYGGIWQRGVRRFAAGGMTRDAGDMPNRHQAKQYPPSSTYRVFGEEETPGLAYVPLSPARKAA